jgi:hypothetical protein
VMSCSYFSIYILSYECLISYSFINMSNLSFVILILILIPDSKKHLQNKAFYREAKSPLKLRIKIGAKIIKKIIPLTLFNIFSLKKIYMSVY